MRSQTRMSASSPAEITISCFGWNMTLKTTPLHSIIASMRAIHTSDTSSNGRHHPLISATLLDAALGVV